MDVKNIAEVSKEEIKVFLDSFDTVVFDCDGKYTFKSFLGFHNSTKKVFISGVLWHVTQTLPGVKECLAALKKLGKGLKFVTNNSVRAHDNYEMMFKTIDIDIHEDDLIHPVRAIIKYLKEINFTGLIYCIGSTTFKQCMTEAGFDLIDDPMELMPESFTHAVKVIRNPQPVKAVIVDVDFNHCHPKCARAAFFLTNPDVLFIAGASDLRLPLAKNVSILGPGYFTKIIEEHSGRKAMNFSKPSKNLAKQVVAHAGNRCLFIGDM